MYTVTITPMQQGQAKLLEFPTWSQACNYFCGKCDELSYTYEVPEQEGYIEAGGIGHDYRIELTKANG